ncbi:MAG: toll/interleukin-1 receptor domain-containing protein [bacterium]
MKLCFISYARNSNLDGRLTKFVEKLQQQLPGHLPHGTKPADVVFFDVMGIENGDEWMLRLAEATRRCRVCVCFYSPPYFTSEYSGREVQVFLQRVHDWKTTNPGRDVQAIIPVIWRPHHPIPAVLQVFQYAHQGLPPAYVEDGLHSLAMRKGQRDAYNRVLEILSARIAAALQGAPLPDGPPIASFGQVASAFHVAPSPTRYGASVILLATPERRMQPFAAAAVSLDVLVERVANRSAVPFREINLGAQTAADVAASQAAREMPVLVADRASLSSPLNQPLVRALAATFDASATVVVFGDPSPNASDAAADLRGLISTAFVPWGSGLGSTSCLVATDPAIFESELERRLTKARHELISADPAGRAQHSGLEAEAAARGISVGSQPVLASPGA